MSDAPSSPRPLQVLAELAEIGLEVARRIGREAQSDLAAGDPARNESEPAPPTPCADLALAYARVSRAVRLTLMLQARLAEAGAAARAEAAPAAPAEVRKARVERIVERLVEAEHPDDEDAVDTLVIRAGERLDDEDLYGDLLDRPMSEIVARLCRDLGLEPDWPRLAQEFWAQEELKSGAPGEPLACLTARPPPLAGGESNSLEANWSNARRGGGGIPPPLRFEPRPELRSSPDLHVHAPSVTS